MKISPDSKISDIASRIGVGEEEELRESDKRRKYLQKVSRIICSKRPNVRLLKTQTAFVQLDDEKDQADITITSAKKNQPVTDFDRKIYDMILQEAFLSHEIGHVRYTDNDSFQSYLGKVDLEEKHIFKSLWNILEDGAIERQMRNRYNVGGEQKVLNANIRIQEEHLGTEIDGQRYLDFMEGVEIFLMDLAIYNSGFSERMLDEDDDSIQISNSDDRERFNKVAPLCKAVVEDVLTESNPKERNKRIYEFYENFSEYLEDRDRQSENLDEMFNGDRDGEGQQGDESEGRQNGGSGEQDEEYGEEPSDADIQGGGYEEADKLEGSVEVEIDDEVESETSRDVDLSDVDEIIVNDNRDDVDDIGEIEEEMEDKYEDEIEQEAKDTDGGESKIEEIEEFCDILDAPDNGGDTYEGVIEIPENEEVDRERKQEAERNSRILSRIFRQRLQREERDKLLRNRRSGKFDKNRMISAERGNSRVFQQKRKGEEKKYRSIIVLDRSSSMDGETIEKAELATGSLAYALEDVGVETSILDLHSNYTRIAKPFGCDIESEDENIFNGSCEGGTPLHETLRYARQRLNKEPEDETFMIVVTDGCPNMENEYRKELEKCTFPVLGVYLAADSQRNRGYYDDHEKWFHRQTYASNNKEGDLRTSLSNLAQEVMF